MSGFTRKQLYRPAGVVAGIAILLLAAVWIGPFEIVRVERAPETQAWAMDPAEEEAVRSAKNLSKAFSAVSEEIVPSVATITSKRVVQVARGFGMNDDEWGDFFRFFGMPQRPRGGTGNGEIVQRSLGSGVIVRSDGYIVTNNHVVADAKEIAVVMSDGEEYDAEIVGTDPRTDVAVIKIDAKGLAAAKIGDSDRLEVGEWVVAIGSPFSENLNHTVTAGIVSAKSRQAVGLADYEDFIQTDAAINPGNSGGALVNLDGEVVGINTAIASRTGGYQGIGFAIPINMVRQVEEALIESGTVTRGWIGIGIQPVTKEIQEALDLPDRNGVLISNIMDDGPAKDADLDRQDVIVGYQGKKVEGMRSFRNQVASTPPGTKVELEILRKGKTRTVELTLGTLPGEGEPKPVLAQEREERLGIDVEEITPDVRRSFGLERREGVVISEVRRGSVASENGLRPGDLILEINQNEIDDLDDYHRALDDVETGEVALFLIERSENTFFVALRMPEE